MTKKSGIARVSALSYLAITLAIPYYWDNLAFSFSTNDSVSGEERLVTHRFL
jgi:hypothetical protein